jgi:hypothetical protein
LCYGPWQAPHQEEDDEEEAFRARERHRIACEFVFRPLEISPAAKK